MASVSLGFSLPLQTPFLRSRQRTVFDATCYCAAAASAPQRRGTAGIANFNTLNPILVNGDPPTFVSAPGRRIVAVGDLHGDLEKARYALRMADVLSPDGQDLWIGGQTVVVQLGDILDRGEDEIAILYLLKSLDVQAKTYGGAVFQVNGNHETMNAEGILGMLIQVHLMSVLTSWNTWTTVAITGKKHFLVGLVYLKDGKKIVRCHKNIGVPGIWWRTETEGCNGKINPPETRGSTGI